MNASWVAVISAVCILGFARVSEAALCDGTPPRMSVSLHPGNLVYMAWTYDGPRDCTDHYNIRFGIVGKGEQQIEVGGAWCPSQGNNNKSCNHELPIAPGEAYVFKVQACHSRTLQTSTCSQWAEAHLGMTPPGGSYHQTCSRATVDGATLTATCRKRNGEEVISKLTVTGCVSDVENCDGVLRCSKGTLPPAGSYRQSCGCIFVDNGFLNAECRMSNGGVRWSDPLPLSGCKGSFDNNEGNLTCKR
jgi:hypothetical protein